MKIKNQFMSFQNNNLKAYLEQYLNGLEIAAGMDDGTISRDELKFVNSIKKEIKHLISVIDKATF